MLAGFGVTGFLLEIRRVRIRVIIVADEAVREDAESVFCGCGRYATFHTSDYLDGSGV